MDYIAELRERTVFTPLKGKAAYLTDWQKSPKSRGEIPDGENVGLLLEHAELTDVDLDSLEAQWTGRVFLPTDTLAAGRGGKIRRYLYEGAAENRTFKDLSGDVLLEVRHKGKQFMRPPSTHPNGERIEWIKDVCPLPLPDEERIIKAAASALIARYVPDGGRHELAMAYAGFMLRKGLTDDEVFEILWAAWELNNPDKDADKDLSSIIADTRLKIDEDKPATGGNTLTKLIPGMTDALCDFFGWNVEPTPEERAEQERQEREKRAQDAWPVCEELAHEADILGSVYEAMRADGLVGEQTNAELLTLVAATRHIGRPMSVMIEGPSSGGKSELIKRQIKVLPDHAVYELQSISDKALAYMGRDALRDRFLVVFELGGLGKEGDAGIEMAKQLLTEGSIKRQIADSTPNGVRGRLVDVEGPTGLWTTTTKLVTDTELNNRLFKLTVDDSPEQTGRIVACIFDEDREPMDFSPIRALHTWIEAQDNRVTLPFGRALGTLMLNSATRMRRDASRVRDLICAHAVLHQASRERDEQGRIVATLEDYEAVRALIDNIIGVAAEQSVSSFVRETVQAVRALIDDNKPVNRTTLGQRFGIAASNASRRLGAATAVGYIKHDPDATGKTKQYVMGDVPLPEDKAALPSVEELDACARALRAQGEGMTASDGECYKRTPSARVRAHVGHHVPLTSTKPLTNGDYGVEGDEDEAPPTDPAHTAHARTHDALDHELAPETASVRAPVRHVCAALEIRDRVNDWGADALPNDAVGWHRLFGKQGYDFTLPEIRGALRLLGDVS